MSDENDIQAYSDQAQANKKSLSMRTINATVANMFKDYLNILDRVQGGGLVGNIQTKLVYADEDSTVKEYGKGEIKFKNGIDTLKYLLDNRDSVSKIIGVSSQDIYNDRRNYTKTKEHLAKLLGSVEMGDANSPMQMYISKMDGNIVGMDGNNQLHWQDMIVTEDWIEDLAKSSMLDGDVSSDYRIQYLAEMVQDLVKDHETDWHPGDLTFDKMKFLDSPSRNTAMEAVSSINAFKKLNYVFYEISKPIGGSSEKHVTVRLFADGTMEVFGVVGLRDCEHWEWEYGSKDYLRSLNTGNQRYMFKLSRPFNDLHEENPLGSNIWWRPDEPDPIPNQDEPKEGEEPKMRYYRPYEAERMLRWFGSTFVPLFDLDEIQTCTVCSAPSLSDDVQGQDFHLDATNIAANGMDLSRAEVDDATSLSLLSMQPTAWMEVENHDD